jgi:ATP-dependent DNA helicase RecG
MLSEELVKVVYDVIDKKCEMQNIELKKAMGGAPQKLYNTLSSFSNQNGGGIIIFGIDEENGFDICGVYDSQDLIVKVTAQASQMIPVIRPLFTIAKIGDKTVVSAEIAECDIIDKPCYYSGAGKIRGSYVRVGEADLPMTEYEIYSYEAFKRKIHDELRIMQDGIAATVNNNELTVYLAKLRNKKPNLSNLSDEDNLAMSGIYSGLKLTIAGLMLFGLYPQGFFPQLCITAVVVPGNEIGTIGEDDARFIDNKKIEGTIPQMLDGALSFVQRNMRIKTIIDENGKRADKAEYPIKAIRELVLNALIHRDYSINTENSPVRIMMFPNRFEIENPGGLYGRITIDTLGKVGADTRNPYIASALEIMIDTENRFSGIPTIRNEMKKAGLKEPLFLSNRGIFSAILLNEKEKLSDGKVSDSKFNESDATSKILDFCRNPKARDELAEFIGISSVSYMMNKYITPLTKNGKLKMTLSDKPRSKNQRYMTV